MKKFLFIFLFIIGGLSIYGQTKVISGRVIDEQGQAIPYVNVVLLNKADSAFISGTVTGEDGVFRLEASNPSQQMLKYSSVGYAECFSAAQDTSIVLPQAAYAIGEVSVSGARPVYRRIQQFAAKHRHGQRCIETIARRHHHGNGRGI